MKKINIEKTIPNAYQGLLLLNKILKQSPLETKYYLLVKIRASQLNQCSFCLEMHTKEALSCGMPINKLNALSAWRDSIHFTSKEKLLLTYVDAMTTIASTPFDEDNYALLLEEFGAPLLGYITLAIAEINAWNRIGRASMF